MGLGLAQNGLTPTKIIEAPRSYDAHFDYRQVEIVLLVGRGAANRRPIR